MVTKPIIQKKVLKILKRLSPLGETRPANYAYLYDRVQVNSKESQLYGTQFAHVDFEKKITELATTHDPKNLDQRRMEMGL